MSCGNLRDRIRGAPAHRGSPRALVDKHRPSRGVDFCHDVHDWRAGYPHEAALAPEIDATDRIFARPKPLGCSFRLR